MSPYWGDKSGTYSPTIWSGFWMVEIVLRI